MQCSPFLFQDTFLHDLVATSFFEALNHQSKTTNQIQEKHCFDMEYMPRQTKNLTLTNKSWKKGKPRTPLERLSKNTLEKKKQHHPTCLNLKTKLLMSS